MGKTIKIKENDLIALREKLNEIMVGTGGVSHNDVSGYVKLYHGTDIPALLTILKTKRVCASDGVQHGETHGLNWFSLVNDGSFNRGACFSLEVPADEIGTTFKEMNNIHVITRESCLDISSYNMKVEYFCGHTREGIIRLYDNLVNKGERYPIEWIRDDLFYGWCERSGNEDTYMSVSDYDFGVIMGNILGEDKVRKEGFINEAAPEVDKFSIGAESSDPPIGGNYYHEGTVEESYGNRIANIDMSEVGEVKCDEWTYDEEEYQEWLADNEIPDTPENKMAYIEDFNVEFEITYIDNQTYHTMGGDWAYYDDLEEVFGEKIAKRIEADMLQYGQSKFDTTELYSDSSYDINNPQELNDIAMKLLPHGEYFKDCRGFVLSNGVVLYTEGEHNDVQRIPGIHDKFQFVELGNIRVLERSIDIGAEPTWEQERVLRQIVSSYEGEKFYVDIFHDGGEISAFYPSADYRYVLGEIDRFYSEGIKPQGGFAYESKKSMKTINENLEPEVSSSEVDLSSFKKRDTLPPKIWKDEETLNSRVRLKLLDIADDFWEFVNLTWVEPKGIIITGSICNFNWSKFSDIDLHLIVDFNEIDTKTEFVRQYLDSKKNEWNNEHEGLKIMGFPVELYVQNIGENPEAGGIYDLEENVWIRRPNPHTIKNIGLNKFSIKDKAAEIMTIIDDMLKILNSSTDSHEIETVGYDASYLWKKIKDLRKKSLDKNGESGAGNIVYKVLRRTGYLDKLWKMRTRAYDRNNSIMESREIINEYLENNHNLPLYKYFKWASTADSCDKADDIAYSCVYYLDRYMKKVMGDYEVFEELYNEYVSNEDVIYDDEFIEKFINTLKENNLCDHFVSIMNDLVPYDELPAWMFMDFNRVVKNEWCIHFGSDAFNISREGFTGGTEELENLAYTNAGYNKHGAGYNFAFPVGERDIDYNHYGDMIHTDNGKSIKTSPEAVIFQTSGIEVYHYGDSQKQVIFWGPYAKNFIPIKYDGNEGSWVLRGLRNDNILCSGEPSEILSWVLNNLPQYRKQIMAGKNGYIPKYYDYKLKKRVPYAPFRNENVKKYLTLLKEEVAMDGSTEHNPYEERWKAERKALKDFVANYGKLMQSREDNKNGKLYKVYYDKTMSELIGYNYCICVQWNEQEMKPGSTVYIRALDKFTPFIRRNLQFDDRGRDNMRGTYDDTGTSIQPRYGV